MAIVVQEINLEVSKPNRFQAIVAKQYDSDSRFLKVTLVNNGEKIEIQQTSTTIINANRNDGESQSYYGVTNEDGTATVPINSWMLALEGDLICDVSIIDADNRKLTSTSFTVLVEKAASGDISSDAEAGIFHKLIEAGDAAEEASQKANSAAELANNAADAANKAAERADDSNISVVLVEQNEEKHLRFWIGTSEEYKEQKDTLEKNTMCIITDDPADEIIKQLITNTGRVTFENGADLNDFTYCCRYLSPGVNNGVVVLNCPTTEPFTFDVVSGNGINTELVAGQENECLLQKVVTSKGDEYFRSVFTDGDGVISYDEWSKVAKEVEEEETELNAIEMVSLGEAPFQHNPLEFSAFIVERINDDGSNRRLLYTNVHRDFAKPEVTAQAFQFNNEGTLWNYILHFYLKDGNWMAENTLDSYTTSTQSKASSVFVYHNLYGIKTPF